MRHFVNAAMTLCIAVTAACSDLSEEHQAKIQQALKVACRVDGVVVPIAQPVVASLGSDGANTASVDSLLVHPAVVAACNAINGSPATAAPTTTPPVEATSLAQPN